MAARAQSPRLTPSPPRPSRRREAPAEAAEVAVPEVAGLTAREAKALIENTGLVADLSADSGVVLNKDNWTVVETTPAAGDKLKAGDTVVVKVTKTEKPKAEKEEKAEAPKAEPAKPAAPAAPEYPSLEHKNAIKSAESYLRVMGFSRQGLIDQLSSEYGSAYPEDVATWAVDNVQVDWNEQAVKSAKSYLDVMAFSRQGLYDQLTVSTADSSHTNRPSTRS